MKKMKFIFCAMLCSMFAFGTFSIANAAQTTKVKVDHSSKIGLLDSFICAYAQMDTDALWEMVPPNLKKNMSVRGKAYAKKTFADGIKYNADQQVMQAFKKVLNDANIRKQVAAEMVKEMERNIVYDNGKYYIDFIGILAAETNDAQAAQLKKPQAIDHSTPEKLIETFYLAILFDDVNTAFEAFHPAMQEELLKTGNADAAKKELMKAFTSVMTPQMRQQMRMVLAGDTKDVLIATMKQQLQKALIQVNGKWYLMIRK